jgi:hypothetical protein
MVCWWLTYAQVMEYCPKGSLEKVIKSGKLLRADGQPDMVSGGRFNSCRTCGSLNGLCALLPPAMRATIAPSFAKAAACGQQASYAQQCRTVMLAFAAAVSQITGG